MRLRHLFALLGLVASLAYAAPTPNNVMTLQKAQGAFIQITAKEVATQLFICNGNSSKIVGLYATNTDSVAHDLYIVNTNASTCAAATSLTVGATNFAACTLNTVTIPGNSGVVAGTPPVNLLSPTNWPGLPTDSDRNPFLFCSSATDVFKAITASTHTANKVVNVIVIYADF